MSSELTLAPVEQMTLAHYTAPGLILPELAQRDAAGIISELTHVLRRQGCIADVLPFYHTALNRELLANSAQSCGIALPHGRLPGVKRLQFAFGRVPEPVLWGTETSSCVQLVFLLAVPATDAVCYLKLLATLARLAQEPDRLGEIRAADNAQAVLAALGKVKLRQ